MKYKTTIKIVTEASDKDEAMDVVGEYLSGNIMSGVDMKCKTRACHSHSKIAISIVALSILVAIGVISASPMRSTHQGYGSAASINAVQPPLRTYNIGKKDAEFKKRWEDIQTKEALRRITR